MALIELNLEKPALKRTEMVEQPDEMGETNVEIREGKELDEEWEHETESESKSRGRGAARKLGMLGATVGAAVLARRVRSRRKKKAADAEMEEEDWQAAESS